MALSQPLRSLTFYFLSSALSFFFFLAFSSASGSRPPMEGMVVSLQEAVGAKRMCLEY